MVKFGKLLTMKIPSNPPKMIIIKNVLIYYWFVVLTIMRRTDGFQTTM